MAELTNNLPEGSWTPSLVLAFVGVLCWLLLGKGERPVSFRRKINLQVS